ncbi:FHA domain-containing protein [Kamptonema cortianum]|nr:FHA domain-containing protein [Geitlerinema splendidum]MDK3160990.1 FHA domain-containing protein [Kamptonema cortianum]
MRPDEELIEDQSETENNSEVEEVNDEATADENLIEGQSDDNSGPRLIVKRSGEETDISFKINPPTFIGRFDPSVGPIDIDLGELEEGVYVSRKHAKITEEDGVYKITDLGSSNGTYIARDGDFQRIDESEISSGDEIALGNARFVFKL